MIGVNVDLSKFSFGIERRKKFKLLNSQQSTVAQRIREDNIIIIKLTKTEDWLPN